MHLGGQLSNPSAPLEAAFEALPDEPLEPSVQPAVSRTLVLTGLSRLDLWQVRGQGVGWCRVPVAYACAVMRVGSGRRLGSAAVAKVPACDSAMLSESSLVVDDPATRLPLIIKSRLSASRRACPA